MKSLLMILLCVASASCVELKNLCAPDCFVYHGLMVNAFHKVPQPQNVTFANLGHYLISPDVTCDPSEFQNKTNYWEALRIKNEL